MVTYQTQAPEPPSGPFRAVADPTRRAILDLLRDGGRPVSEIAGLFPVSRPAISRHLRLLREAGLVVEKRRGRKRIYRLDPAPLEQLDRWIEEYRRFWRQSLLGLKRHVERGADDESEAADERKRD